jgi:hypothetical protein
MTSATKVPSLTTLDEVVEVLSLYDRSDGVLKTTHSTGNPPPVKRAKANGGKAVESAHVVIADRKRKPVKQSKTTHPSKKPAGEYVPPAWPITDKTLCYGCRGRGHIAADPTRPTYGERREKNTSLLDAVLKTVEEDSD